MAGNPSAMKRQKEQQRRDRKAAKLQDRQQRRAGRQEKPKGAEGEDPDIAGIVPGPQPLPTDT